MAGLLGRPVMSWINLGEVYYTIHRAAGAAEAGAIVALLRPLLPLDAATPDRVMAATRIRRRARSPSVRASVPALAPCHSRTSASG